MDTTIWAVTVVLAAIFALAGTMKLVRSRERLAESGQAWVQDFSPAAVRGIGVLELLGAAGLLLPALVGTATALVAVAAAGLLALMLGAALTHLRRGEHRIIPGNLALAAMALFVLVTRVGPYPL